MLSEINVLNGQTIFDIVIMAYGSPDYMGKLLSDNPGIYLNYDFDANPNTKVFYDASFVSPSSALTPAPAPEQPNTAYLKGVYGQTIFDILLMTYGAIESFVKLQSDNNINGANDIIIDQLLFNFETSGIADNLFYQNIIKNKTIIATKDQAPVITIGRAFSRAFSLAFS